MDKHLLANLINDAITTSRHLGSLGDLVYETEEARVLGAKLFEIERRLWVEFGIPMPTVINTEFYISEIKS